MIDKSKLHSLITSGIDESDPQLYTRVLFTSALLYVVGLVLIFFIVFHFVFTKNYQLGVLESIAFGLVVFLYLLLRFKKSIKLIGHVSAVAVLSYFISFIQATQNVDLSFVWVFFAPFFVVLINGWKIGFFYLAIFFAYIFPLAYINIGVWENGGWSDISFYRFVVGLILGTSIAMLIDVAQQVSNRREQAIRQKEGLYLKQLEHLSTTDGLTSLYNRHYFNRVFADKAKTLNRSERFLMFFIIDIDNFKAYNDHYGHQAGDEVIQSVALAIREYVHRENDLVFRLGGEEFGGLIETRNPEQTAKWLTGLTAAIQVLDIPHAPQVAWPCVTISGGASATNFYQDSTVSDLYKRADDALYQAKNNGRNQFVVLEPVSAS
ncbi:MAG: GGDEF domain-containing protein [Pseudomonadota bacterium]|nr:GGDEF domain-containing protein [Pseudomonadota bacterium]